MKCVEKRSGANGWRGAKLGGALAAASGIGLFVGLAIPFPGAAQEPQTFEAPVGLVVNYVRPAGTADFESIMLRLQQALAGGELAEGELAEEEDVERRRAQAEGWTIYKARELGPNNQAVYVWLLNPAVGGGDYAVPQILAEAFPAEAQQLYETYNESFGAGQIWLNLDPVVADGSEETDEVTPPAR